MLRILLGFMFKLFIVVVGIESGVIQLDIVINDIGDFNIYLEIFGRNFYLSGLDVLQGLIIV